MTGFAPDHAGAAVVPSPNFGQRKDGKRPRLVILHYTGMDTGEAAEAFLASAAAEVSAHYLVHEDGRVVQMVPESERAWHAGRSSWHGESDINSVSIGIEIVNPGPLKDFPPFAEAGIEATIALCRDLSQRHGIAPEAFLAHSDVAPGRKIDPGEKFPWRALHQAGIGHLVDPVPIAGGRFLALGDTGQPVEALQSMLALYGYGVPINGSFGPETEIVVAAFQRHFRTERVDGVADASTIATLHRLLAALPLPPAVA